MKQTPQREIAFSNEPFALVTESALDTERIAREREQSERDHADATTRQLTLPKTKLEAVEALKVLRPFIGRSQMHCLADACRGEEKQWFFDKLCELAALVTAMPKTYEQDGKGDRAIASLHYFVGGCDWWVTEKDIETPDALGQHQAFGLASLGDEPELGYISIVELLANGAELDLHFNPRTLAEVRAGLRD